MTKLIGVVSSKVNKLPYVFSMLCAISVLYFIFEYHSVLILFFTAVAVLLGGCLAQDSIHFSRGNTAQRSKISLVLNKIKVDFYFSSVKFIYNLTVFLKSYYSLF